MTGAHKYFVVLHHKSGNGRVFVRACRIVGEYQEVSDTRIYCLGI